MNIDWQPWATAPRDGEQFLVHDTCKTCPELVLFDSGGILCLLPEYEAIREEYSTKFYTHWIRIPPPKETT